MTIDLKPFIGVAVLGIAVGCGDDRPGFGDDETETEGTSTAVATGGAAGAGGGGSGNSMSGMGGNAGRGSVSGAGGDGPHLSGAGGQTGSGPSSGGGSGAGGEPSGGAAGGAAGGASDNGVVVCSDGETRCGTECVDTRQAAAHCGGCNQPCAAGEECTGGNCQQACESPLVLCDGTCVDVTSDAAHCGDCDEECSAPEGGAAVCTLGTCGIECDGTTACGDECVNTEASVEHCGDCDQACEEGQVCSLGACGTSCDAPLEACDGACVDLETDPAHCGACGDECPVPTGGIATCSDAQCDVECDGLTPCQGACVDTITDESHCGGCQNSCSGECVDGTCCPADRDVCDGECVDLDSSADHCGECGNDCSSSEVCEDGECVVECTNGDRCGDDCVNLSTDLDNCQSCGEQCSPPAANGSAVCASSGCDIQCNANSLRCGDTCCNPPASGLVQATCNGNTCGVQCTTGNHACAGGNPGECYDDEDPLKCGTACTNCTQQYATAACEDGQCANTCVDGPDLGCESSPGKPVCGFWSFETNSTDTEGWEIDSDISPGWGGVFGLTTQRATEGTRSLTITYNGTNSGYSGPYATIRRELCSNGLGADLSARDLRFDLYATTSTGPSVQSNQTGGYIAFFSGTTTIGDCDFYFNEGANQLSCTAVPAGQITSVTLGLRVFTSWTGTFYLDNIRFE